MPPIERHTLRTAVAKSSTWKELYRRLGYAGSPPGGSTRQRIRQAISSAGIDSSHLNGKTGPKTTWTDDDLRAAVLAATTWKQVTDGLGCNYATAKLNSERLGLDTSHFPLARLRKPPKVAAIVDRASPKRFGQAAESVAVAWYALHGYSVFVPACGIESSADLLAVRGDSMRRVQVKSGGRKASSGHVEVGISHGARSKSRARPYLAAEVDEFFVITSDFATYRIPREAVDAKKAIVLGPKYEKYRVDLTVAPVYL